MFRINQYNVTIVSQSRGKSQLVSELGPAQPQLVGLSCQLSLNKFFDPSTPSMRKGRDGEWKKWKMEWKKNNGENSGPL